MAGYFVNPASDSSDGPHVIPDRLDSDSDDEDEHPGVRNYSRSHPWPRRTVFRSLDGGAGSDDGRLAPRSSDWTNGGRGHHGRCFSDNSNDGVSRRSTAGALETDHGPLRFGRLPPPRSSCGRRWLGEWRFDGPPLVSNFDEPRLPLRLGSGSLACGSRPSAAGPRDDPAFAVAMPYPATSEPGFDLFDPMLDEASFARCSRMRSGNMEGLPPLPPRVERPSRSIGLVPMTLEASLAPVADLSTQPPSTGPSAPVAVEFESVRFDNGSPRCSLPSPPTSLRNITTTGGSRQT